MNILQLSLVFLYRQPQAQDTPVVIITRICKLLRNPGIDSQPRGIDSCESTSLVVQPMVLKEVYSEKRGGSGGWRKLQIFSLRTSAIDSILSFELQFSCKEKHFPLRKQNQYAMDYFYKVAIDNPVRGLFGGLRLFQISFVCNDRKIGGITGSRDNRKYEQPEVGTTGSTNNRKQEQPEDGTNGKVRTTEKDYRRNWQCEKCINRIRGICLFPQNDSVRQY